MKYRKKPVIVEAFQLKAGEPIPVWFSRSEDKVIHIGMNSIEASIKTLEGAMLARSCDWIIKGVKGELYPCKPDIFEAIYEPVPDQSESEPNPFWKPIEKCPKEAMKDYLLLLKYKNRTCLGRWYDEQNIFCSRDGLQLNDSDIAYYAEILSPPDSESESE